ncbi:Phosphate transport system permease protein 2 [Lentisphaera araneosa HTCC2155]|uniref:Phosphate transport system permease protein PstA n=1 Tax=Lentisphaera araneosa HTCC2155 TaxID=313628 RepID=A6DFF8_9BACT|nr:phosphate ABC transporter permease PstA [Lentisphaera araneosa]EDM29538.1 Phosphate transport system permease protein 2 [Lentisphaera araneosa HTCC2155]
MSKEHKIKGETRVWITGLGLSAGLIMTLSILGLIFYYGLSVFWPKDVVTVNVPEELAIRDKKGTSTSFWGIEVKRVEQQIPGRSKEEKPISVQYYTANRDAYGNSFIFVKESQLNISEQLDPNVMIMERESESRAIVKPLKIVVDGKEIEASAANFIEEFDNAIQHAADKRHAAEELVGGILLDIANEIKNLKVVIHKKQLAEQDTSAEEAQMKELKARADENAKKVNDLYEEKDKDSLTVQVNPNGMTYEMPIGEVIRYNFPNQLGTMSRLSLFFENVYEYVTAYPREANTEGGIFPAIIGTLVMTIVMCIPVTFFGVITAIYLHEYAKDSLVTRAVRIAINNLAGVPSIVFGAFGLGFFIYFIGSNIDDFFFKDWKLATGEPIFGTGGLLWASLTLALMTLPVVIVSTEEALSSVPHGLREGAMGCGATKWQSIWTVILPSATPGIITGMILAMARGAGEVAPLMLVGVVKLAPSLPVNATYPFVHIDQKFMHLGFHIYDLGFQSPDSEAAKPMVYATTLFLILTVTGLNLAGIIIRQRLKKRFATGAF